jgi:hypothetical protein
MATSSQIISADLCLNKFTIEIKGILDLFVLLRQDFDFTDNVIKIILTWSTSWNWRFTFVRNIFLEPELETILDHHESTMTQLRVALHVLLDSVVDLRKGPTWDFTSFTAFVIYVTRS